MLHLLSRCFAVVLIVVLSPLVFLSGQEKKKATPAVLLPGPGVADPAGKVGFFPSTTGGIDALDLANGKLLWTSKDANRPLLAAGNSSVRAEESRQGKSDTRRGARCDQGRQARA